MPPKRPSTQAPPTPKRARLASPSTPTPSRTRPTRRKATTHDGTQPEPATATPTKPQNARTPRRTGAARGRARAPAKELAGDEGDADELAADSLDSDDATTPARKRKTTTTRARTPTPPRDAPASEHYFFQNRPGGLKTSGNTLSALALLTHEDYFAAARAHTDPHRDAMDYLHHLHSRAFAQWAFELDEGFALCLYGWGSKRFLLASLADYLASETPGKIVVVNGFNPTLGLRDVLLAVASTVPALRGTKLGAQPADMLGSVLSALPPAPPLTVLVHSIDGPALRRAPAQALLARLAAHPGVRLVASADAPHVALLWDAATRARFNWLFHDATTFQAYEAEVGAASGGGGVVDEVNALLGRSGRRVHGREGVVFVLRSLTESARRLFGLLLSEVLSSDAGDEPPLAGGDDDDFEQAVAGRPAPAAAPLGGIEYRALYRKAVQALITGSEMSFRQLLKEFFDHQMVASRRDALGAEILGVPFRRDECEAILEDLVIEQ